MLNLGIRHVLLGAYILLLGGGTYFTYVKQERTIATLTEKIQAQDGSSSTPTTLEEQQKTLEKRIEDLQNQRRSHYKQIPEHVTSAQVLRYVTSVASTGFDTFDLSVGGRRSEDGYQVFTVTATGRAPFPELYHFVWTLENHRPFYRIENLQLSLLDQRTTDRETGRPQMDVLVRFEMDVEAIFGLGGADVPETSNGTSEPDEQLPSPRTNPHPPVPSDVLPPGRAGTNPFYPLVFDQIPPNEQGRLNVEQAKLVSIVDGRAVFETDSGIKQIGEGDRVYLGRIVEIDPAAGRLVAQLNKGGIVVQVERTIGASDSSRDNRDSQ